MLSLEWNMDDALKARFEEGRKEGREEGRKEGREEGRKEGRKEGREEGREEGINVGIESVALNMLRRGKSFDDIHADTNLSLGRIKELAKNAHS